MLRFLSFLFFLSPLTIFILLFYFVSLLTSLSFSLGTINLFPILISFSPPTPQRELSISALKDPQAAALLRVLERPDFDASMNWDVEHVAVVGAKE